MVWIKSAVDYAVSTSLSNQSSHCGKLTSSKQCNPDLPLLTSVIFDSTADLVQLVVKVIQHFSGGQVLLVQRFWSRDISSTCMSPASALLLTPLVD